MSEAGGRERLGLTLLVQLFGRDVLDRLARDGFDSTAAIAAAGPERLASTTGIPLSLAERIAAVARETGGPAPKTRVRPGLVKTRSRRRSAPKRPAAAVEEARARDQAAESDPVVDDVALVSWMGFSSKAHGGRRTFSVADSILDPLRPGLPPEIPRDDHSTVSSRSPGSGEATPAPAGSASPERARSQPDPAPMTLAGSFWSFGRRTDAAPPWRDPHDR